MVGVVHARSQMLPVKALNKYALVQTSNAIRKCDNFIHANFFQMDNHDDIFLIRI